MELRPYQRAAVDAIYEYFKSGKRGNPIVSAPTACHGAGTHIMLIDGSTKEVEQIVVGDLLMGADSTPRIVLDLHRGKQMLYKITPISGESFVVNEDHILALYRTNDGKVNKHNCKIFYIRLGDYLAKSKTFKHTHKLFRKSIRLSHCAVPVPPWVVGAMLGDGSLNHQPRFTKIHGAATKKICEYVRSIGCEVTVHDREETECKSFVITDSQANCGRENTFKSLLREAKIWGLRCEDKHVPLVYKYNSREVRLEVLAGLLDTDGSVPTDGRSCFDFISKSKQLSLDVQYLARSVGLLAQLSECEKFCQTGMGGTYWRVYIGGDAHLIPTCQKIAPIRSQRKNWLVTGFSVDPIGIGDFYGFSLDGDHLYLTGDFVVHHNSGKSILIGKFCQEVIQTWPNQRILMLAHRKELLQQNAAKLLQLWPDAPLGVYSAGLKSRQLGRAITMAGIASIYNKAKSLQWVDLILCDEVHLFPPDGEGMYQHLLRDLKQINPNIKLIGFTATPYRMKSGLLTDPGGIFTDIAYEIEIPPLIKDGYLCPLVSKSAMTQAVLSGVGKRGGEYISGEAEAIIDQDSLTQAAITEMEKYCSDRKSWIIFAQGVEHAKHVTEALNNRGHEAEFIIGESDTMFRESTLNRFKSGQLKCLVNCDVLTTGFDAPNIDALILLRATGSTGLYVQILGRAMRIHPDKRDAIVLDFCGNIERHGPIDEIRIKKKGGGAGSEAVTTAPVKICEKCRTSVAISVRLCPSCGSEFPIESKTHDVVASERDVMSINARAHLPQRLEVLGITYKRHEGKNGKPPSMRVIYELKTGEGNLEKKILSEWVHCENRKMYSSLVRWWRPTSKLVDDIVIPTTVDEALKITNTLMTPKFVWVQKDGEWDRVVDREFPSREEVLGIATAQEEAKKRLNLLQEEMGF